MKPNCDEKPVRPRARAKGKASRIGRAPLDGYEKITRQELAELKRLSVKEAIRRLEILLKAAAQWRK